MSQDTFITKRLHRVASLSDVRLLNNYLLVKECWENLDKPTKDGIYLGSYKFHKNQFLSSHANRIHEIVKVCDKLTFWNRINKTSGNCLRWRTTNQIEVGDIAWISYTSSIDYDAVECDGEIYKLINYAEVRLVKKPDGRTVLVNGWCLYKHPQISRSSILVDPKPEIDYSKGMVVQTGERNTAYVTLDKKWIDTDTADIKEGDTFVKDNKAHTLLLEDNLFRYYSDEELYLILRKNIVAVL